MGLRKTQSLHPKTRLFKAHGTLQATGYPPNLENALEAQGSSSYMLIDVEHSLRQDPYQDQSYEEMILWSLLVPLVLQGRRKYRSPFLEL